jgi:hypothetical protein
VSSQVALLAFSGMLKVDPTTGTLVSGSFDVTLPGLPTFDNVFFSDGISTFWRFVCLQQLRRRSAPCFHPSTNPRFVGGLHGGSIFGGNNDLSTTSSPAAASRLCLNHHRWFSLVAACWCSA